MFQNELDKVKAQLSLKGEFQLPVGDWQPTISRSRALPVPGGLPRSGEPLCRGHPLSEAEGMVRTANCFARATSSGLFLRQEHLKPCIEPESTAWPRSAVTQELTASLNKKMHFFFFAPFLITGLQICSTALSGASLKAKALVCLLGNSQLHMAKAHSLQQMRERVKVVSKSSSGKALGLFGCCSATCVARRADGVQCLRTSIFPSLILEDV